MHDVKRINVKENILEENDRIAADINKKLTARGVLCVNQMGAPGAGKTTALKNIIRHMRDGDAKAYVIEGDIESDIDTRELQKLGIGSYQINTFGACHLDAPMARGALDHIGFTGPGVLFIENIGNLVCPAEFAVGEHIRMLIASVTDGGDKPYKYPLAFERADIILLNKTDLLPYVDFDEVFFTKGVRALNKEAPIFQVSGRTGEGFESVWGWLSERLKGIAATGRDCPAD